MAATHTCAHPTSNASPGLGSQTGVFILILRVMYTRPSELLALRKKDLVPLLVPLLPYWSVVIAPPETGVSTETGVRDGSVSVDQRWLQWVNKLVLRLKCANLVERIWCFDFPAAAKLFKTATDALGLSGMTMYQTRHSGASIDRVRGFRTLQKFQKNEVSGELSEVSQDTTRAVAWRPTITLSLARSETTWKHSRNVPKYC